MNTKTLKYPNLPYITGNNKERVFTKHWANLPLHLDRNAMALLSFITFQAKADNTFKYSLVLITKYKKAIEYANEEYNGKYKLRLPNGLSVTPGFIKFWFDYLVENGWIIGLGGKDYMVNPVLTYIDAYVSKAQYKELCLLHKTHPGDVAEYFKGIVNPKIKAKKNYHVYWP